jgi:hypothetical protein
MKRGVVRGIQFLALGWLSAIAVFNLTGGCS